MADIFPGARVVEAGVGSGALTCFLLRAVGDRGHVHLLRAARGLRRRRPQNVEKFYGGPHATWRLSSATSWTPRPTSDVDRVILDMLAPWECVDAVAKALIPGGVICCYVATTTQLSRTVETLREHGSFTEPHAWETLVRDWHVEGLAVRPDHRMVGHTGFLVTARRMADGVTPPPRRRRPAKGVQVEESTSTSTPHDDDSATTVR